MTLDFMSLKLAFRSLPCFLCLDGETGDDRSGHLACDSDEIVFLRLDAAHHVVDELVLHVVVAQRVELDGVLGIDGCEEHHLLQPSGLRRRLDHLREKVDVSFRVDDGNIIALQDVLLDHGFHEPRLADAGGPEAAEMTAPFLVGNRNKDVPGPVGEVHPSSENRDAAIRTAFPFPVYLVQTFEAVYPGHD